ncbi:hypothetical protein BpHYR1_006847 [Brachionus plicatilis]|uniref:Uncharacterized protein n=1 Tax=Brachionus plicatilis TaxID=10195 RepID=A0A3M7P9F6_BRAPC|nr:hypothetical protein BpHYR1_006847 [Brachionus plicatilis]
MLRQNKINHELLFLPTSSVQALSGIYQYPHNFLNNFDNQIQFSDIITNYFYLHQLISVRRIVLILLLNRFRVKPEFYKILKQKNVITIMSKMKFQEVDVLLVYKNHEKLNLSALKEELQYNLKLTYIYFSRYFLNFSTGIVQEESENKMRTKS